MITNVNQVYAFIDQTIEKCQQVGLEHTADDLSNALSLGSSGLEILGAVRYVLDRDSKELRQYVDANKMDEVLGFIRNAWGD